MIGALCMAFAGLPFAMTIWNLRELKTPARALGCPCVSVLIPARNEESNIGAACAAVLASEGVALELVVLDDASTDRTRDILAGIADRRLRVASAPPLPAGWCGKQHACHVLGEMAEYELMVFVDADVRLAPDALSRMAGFMQRTDASLASGFPRQLVVTWSEQLLLPLIHFVLLGFLPMALMRRFRSPAFGAGCGQLIIVRQSTYQSVGGHASIRSSLHDGLTLPRRFRTAGHQTLLFDATFFSQCRMYSSVAEIWEGLCKNATEGMARLTALPIWTAILVGGQIIPALLIWIWPSWTICSALSMSMLTRLILSVRFRQPLSSAVLQPLGITALLIVQWFSLLRASLGGRSTWRGRAYMAQQQD